ncbi:hypothetical protein D4764_0165630, partial [Takifugu flavidus]
MLKVRGISSMSVMWLGAVILSRQVHYGKGSTNRLAAHLRAKATAEEMDIEHFQGGPSWCFCFMRRRHFSIRARTTVAQRLPADYQERAAIFHTYCRER